MITQVCILEQNSTNVSLSRFMTVLCVNSGVKRKVNSEVLKYTCVVR
jgi:hypothetical protein